jgi:hypothetical protein
LLKRLGLLIKSTITDASLSAEGSQDVFSHLLKRLGLLIKSTITDASLSAEGSQVPLERCPLAEVSIERDALQTEVSLRERCLPLAEVSFEKGALLAEVGVIREVSLERCH